MYDLSADGHICSGALSDVLNNSRNTRLMRSERSLKVPVTGLHRVSNRLMSESYVVGSGEDGSIGVWELESVLLWATLDFFQGVIKRFLA
jgi:hypothetical protein